MRPDRVFAEKTRKLKTRIDRLEAARMHNLGLALEEMVVAPIILDETRMLGDVSITASFSDPTSLCFTDGDITTYVQGPIDTIPRDAANVPTNVTVANNDTKAYFSYNSFVGQSGIIAEFDLSRSEDSTSLTYTGNSLNPSGNSADEPRGLVFENSTSFITVIHSTDQDIGMIVREYTLSTPWDISTATAGNSYHLTNDFDGFVSDIDVRPDGTTAWFPRSDEVIILDMSTGWDLSTATESRVSWNTVDSNLDPDNVDDLHWNSDGSYIIINDGNLREYSAGINYDIESLTFVQERGDIGALGLSAFDFNSDYCVIYAMDAGANDSDGEDRIAPWPQDVATWTGSFLNQTLIFRANATAAARVWETQTDWDNAVSRSGIVNESVANTDHADAATIRLGYEYTNPVAQASVLGYYPLDEDSGTTVNDVINNNNATSSSLTVNATGLLGTSGYDFTGSGSIESFPFTLGSQTAYSVSVWVNPDSTTGPEYLFKETNTGNGPSDVVAGFIDSGNMVFEQRNGGATTISAPVTANAWSHWVFQWDGTSVLLYENGSQVASGAEDGINSGTNALAVGYNNDTNGSFYDGQMDELRFYSSNLTSTQIQSIYDVVSTDGLLTTASKTYSTAQQPDLYDLLYSLNGESITVDVIGSPGTASEEIITQVLDGATGYSLAWSNSHTDFRVNPQLSTSTVTASPTMGRIGVKI